MESEMEALKKIGIIGGSGPEATILLQKMIIDLARERYGAKRLEYNPHLLIASVPLLQDVKNDEELETVVSSLKSGAESLKNAGAEILCMACNTHHLSLEKVKEHVGVPFISMLDLVGKEISRTGAKKVAVIGTGYTLRDALYEQPVKENGGVMTDIGEELTEKSHKVIGEALSGITKDMVGEYVSLVEKIMKEHGGEVDTIILGCTEYSVLENMRDKSLSFPDVKIIDPLKLLAEAVVESSYKN